MAVYYCPLCGWEDQEDPDLALPLDWCPECGDRPVAVDDNPFLICDNASSALAEKE